MEVHFTPEVQYQLDQLASETGRPQNEFVQDAVSGYLDELVSLRGTLGSRYDDLKSGKVQPVNGEEAFQRLNARTQEQRKHRG
jgi:predicted DNA-binding protein